MPRAPPGVKPDGARGACGASLLEDLLALLEAELLVAEQERRRRTARREQLVRPGERRPDGRVVDRLADAGLRVLLAVLGVDVEQRDALAADGLRRRGGAARRRARRRPRRRARGGA